MTFSTLASPGVSLQGGGGSGGGGGGTPGGSNTQIQYNSSGTFAGASGLTTNGTELTIASGTKTADAPVLNMSQTWNNGAVTFTGLKFNAAGTSDANSAAASLLMDLQVNTASKFRVTKPGNVYAAALFGTSTGPANGFNLNVFNGSQIVVYTNNGTTVNAFDTNGFKTASTAAFGFTDTGDPSGGIDTILTRRGAANLRFGAADVGATTATVTITIATPGVVTWTRHTLSTGTPVVFTTTGALPTGITSGTTYYAVVVDTNTFQIASSVANAIAATPTVITTSGSQSGTHTGTRYNITQRLSMQSVTGVTDRLGADLIITGSQGTGTGAGGSIIFQVAPAGGSGAAQNGLVTFLEATSSRLFNVYGAFTDASNYERLTLNFTASNDYAINVNKAGTGSNRSLTIETYGNSTATFESETLKLPNNGRFAFSSTSASRGAVDLILARDAANTLALRNGTNAQAFRVYNTTDGTNSEFGGIRWAANVFTIGPQTAGTGTARATSFVDGGGTERIGINASNGVVTVSSMQLITSSGISYIGAETSGFTLRYASASNTDMMVRFTGTSASFPALKRSSASLIVRLADDTANAALESASLKTDAPAGGTAATWKLGVRVAATTLLDTTQYIEVDVGGTLYKLAVVTT
jgi:hypothetical protein